MENSNDQNTNYLRFNCNKLLLNVELMNHNQFALVSMDKWHSLLLNCHNRILSLLKHQDHQSKNGKNQIDTKYHSLSTVQQLSSGVVSQVQY